MHLMQYSVASQSLHKYFSIIELFNTFNPNSILFFCHCVLSNKREYVKICEDVVGRRWHVDVRFRALHPLTVTCWAFFCSHSHITVFIISASPEWVHTQFIFQLASLLKAYHNISRPEKFISHTQNGFQSGSLGQNNIVSSSLHKTETNSIYGLQKPIVLCSRWY